jgi:allene oxide cyclase-like protein
MMARKLFIGGLGATLVAAAVVGVSLASASSGGGARAWGAPVSMVHYAHVASVAASGSDPTTIVVLTRHERETDVDNPPAGFGQGDEAAITSALFNTGGQRVGHFDAAGVFTAVFSATQVARGQFTFTATLAHGQITATGVGTFGASTTGFTAAVTGGTGAYRNTDGQVQVTFTGPHSTRFVYQLSD